MKLEITFTKQDLNNALPLLKQQFPAAANLVAVAGAEGALSLDVEVAHVGTVRATVAVTAEEG